jgi:hypothetical protein
MYTRRAATWTCAARWLLPVISARRRSPTLLLASIAKERRRCHGRRCWWTTQQIAGSSSAQPIGEPRQNSAPSSRPAVCQLVTSSPAEPGPRASLLASSSTLVSIIIASSFSSGHGRCQLQLLRKNPYHHAYVQICCYSRRSSVIDRFTTVYVSK